MCNSSTSFYIETGWEKTLGQDDGSVWLSRKRRNEKGVHVNLKKEGNQFSAEGDVIALLKNTKVLSVSWRTEGTVFFAPQKTFELKKPITSLDVSSGGLAVFSSGEKAYIFDSKDGEIRREFTEHIAELYQSRFFPSGLVCLSYGADMQIKIWSCADGKCPVTLKGHTQAVTCMYPIGKGKLVASVSKDGFARVWKCGDSTCVAQIELNAVLNCCTVLDCVSQKGELQNIEEEDLIGKLLLVGGEEGVLYAINLASSTVVSRFSCKSAVNTLSSTRTHLAAGCESGEVLVFALSTLDSPIAIHHVSNSPVLSLLCLADGIICGRTDGSVTLQPFISGPTHCLTGCEDRVVSIQRDNEYVYTASRDGCVRKYSLSYITKRDW